MEASHDEAAAAAMKSLFDEKADEPEVSTAIHQLMASESDCLKTRFLRFIAHFLSVSLILGFQNRI